MKVYYKEWITLYLDHGSNFENNFRIISERYKLDFALGIGSAIGYIRSLPKISIWHAICISYSISENVSLSFKIILDLHFVYERLY